MSAIRTSETFKSNSIGQLKKIEAGNPTAKTHHSSDKSSGQSSGQSSAFGSWKPEKIVQKMVHSPLKKVTLNDVFVERTHKLPEPAKTLSGIDPGLLFNTIRMHL